MPKLRETNWPGGSTRSRSGSRRPRDRNAARLAEGRRTADGRGAGKLGIDGNNELFWDGQRLVTRNKLLLIGPQTVLAVLAAIATVNGGINNASTFLCARNVHWLTCSAPTVCAPGQSPK